MTCKILYSTSIAMNRLLIYTILSGNNLFLNSIYLECRSIGMWLLYHSRRAFERFRQFAIERFKLFTF